ncbi:ROK family protein [Arthrobacter sp. 35W]|uniref:ROK family protein n=1 Tax=Arthrobacter sp. 35W TaxID=1132441 RepID=UPI000413EE64|nr:ROK family protein [Arthrobacter sp. 35W]
MALRSTSAAAGPAGSLVSGDVRRHNLSIVARYVVDHGASSRSQIADGAGLTRGSVTALASLLLDAGVLREDAPQDSRGKGRPLTLLHLAADDVAILALQLDADEVTAVVATLSGEPLLRIAEHHGRPMGAPEPILDLMASVLGRALDACAGLGRRLVDSTVVVFAPVGGTPPVVVADTDLGWGRVDVLAGLRAREPRTPPSMRLLPDSVLAAQAELGLLEDGRDMVYIKSNSGIGGAIIVDGTVVAGAHDVAGALGHLPLVPGGEQCGCGQRGCLVTVSGPDAVLRAAGLGRLLESDGLSAALDELVSRILAGEQHASAAWNDAAEWIARALQVLAMALDPRVIVLGGYWAPLADSIAESFAQNRPAAVPGDPWIGTAVVPGRLDRDAALLGALWSARDRLLLDPLQIST